MPVKSWWTKMYLSDIDYCCGVYHLADFGNEDDYEGEGPDEAEIFQELQRHMDSNKPGFWYQAWFKRNRNFSGGHDASYEHEELKALVKAIPGCIELPETINPNSGNILQGYLWQAGNPLSQR